MIFLLADGAGGRKEKHVVDVDKREYYREWIQERKLREENS